MKGTGLMGGDMGRGRLFIRMGVWLIGGIGRGS